MKGKFQLACSLFTLLLYQSVTLKQTCEAWRDRRVQLQGARLHLVLSTTGGALPTEAGKSDDHQALKISPQKGLHF